jgi:hypothetical protein
MKIINCNNWTPRHKLNLPMISIPITDPPVDLQVYFAYSREVAWFYYRMEEFGIYGFLNRG